MDKAIAKHKVTGSTLKLIALFTMLIDHFAATVLLDMINRGLGDKTLIDIYWVMRSIGRMAFPVYCFLLVEGFKYTHSRMQYAARLFLFALISEIPFDLAINHTVLEYKSNNVFFTLLLGLLTIIVLDQIKSVQHIEKSKSTARWLFMTLIKCIILISVVLVMMIIAEFVLCCDYGAAGVGCIVIMYLLEQNREIAFAAAVILLGLFSGSIEFFALFMLIPIHFYNGERGMSLKYVFYVFYPAHLLVLYFLGEVVTKT